MRVKNDYSSRFRILKGGKISLIVSAILGGTTLSFSAPSGGIVTSGVANISQNTNITNITQSSSKASINWNKFDIKANEIVNFNQPNVNSITLNRVVGNENSIINGALNANGQVWLLNSNGVLFGKNASINTSGLIATTKELSDTNFQNSNYTFTGDSTNSVINLGAITVQNSGYIVLASNEVVNSGSIEAIKGKIYLTGANEYTLNLNGNSLLDLTVDKGVLDALVKNSGTIIADGGEIYLTANAVNELLRGVVNNTGIIEANSLDGITGHVELFAHGGEAQIGGTIKATEGFIETSGKDFTLLDDATIQAGHWLIDPVDITINTTLANTIEIALETGDVTIETTTSGASTVDTTGNESGTAGNIHVNSAINWSANTLTLKADNDININAQLDLTSTAGLFLQYAQTTSTGTYNVYSPINIASTGSFKTQHASDAVINYTIISNVTELQNINSALSGKYALGTNIDASSISNFTPIGNSSTKFTGIFDGLGHTVDSLTINRSTTNNVGLFGYSTGTLKNVGVTNANITGKIAVGALAGENTGTVSNSYATGSVSGSDHVGGLVGYNYKSNSIVSNSYATASVSGTNDLGGLVGDNSFGKISNSYATGSVSGSGYLGGLVGQNTGTISNSYSTSSVSGTGPYVGGLVGYNNHTVTNSFWDTTTSGQSSSAGGTGLTDAQMQTSTNFTNAAWDTSIWAFGQSTAEGYQLGYPYLKSISSTQNALFTSGLGTSGSPYTITNWQQLQNINYNTTTLGSVYNLLNDLETSTSGYDTYASSSANSNAGFDPLGDATHSFRGTFDGLGHVISNLTIDRAAEDFVGLFGITQSSTIQNIGLENVAIKGRYYVGGLVGKNTLSSISNSYAIGNITGDNYLGGLVGGNDLSSISNSYAIGNITGISQVGGLTGYSTTDSSITNSYAVTNVNGSSYIGGLVGRNSGNSSITNSYASGSATGTFFVGGLVGDNAISSITNSYYDNESNAASMDDSSYGKTKAEIRSLITGAPWSLTRDTAVEGYQVVLLPYLSSITRSEDIQGFTLFESGLGNLANPYIIKDVNQLQNIGYNSDTLSNNYYYNLGNDIDASSIANFDPIGDWTSKFTGTFDGLGHTVDSLYINRSGTDYIGLFGYSIGSVKNIGVTNVDITGGAHVGGLIGINGGNISNSYTTGSVSGQRNVGGLVGDNFSGTIANSYSMNSVSGGNAIGGLVGSNFDGTVSNSYTTGSVLGSNLVGGLIGENFASTVTNSFYDKDTNTASMADNSLGKTKAEIRSLITGGLWSLARDSAIEGYQAVLLPYLSSITRSEDIQGTTLFEGGFGNSVNPFIIKDVNQLQNIGYDSDTLSNNYYYNLSNDIDASGIANFDPLGDSTTKFKGVFDGLEHVISNLTIDRAAEDYIGLFGYTNGATIQNVGLENVDIKGNYTVGVLVGQNNNSNITNSYVTGSVTGTQFVGGIAGYNAGGTITNSYVTGSVSGTGFYTGGLVGGHSGTIQNSYATGSVSGYSSIGGLVGYNNFSSIITNSYATGSVSGHSFVGGLVGENWKGTIQNSYASGSVSGHSLFGGLVGENYDGTTTNSFWDTQTTGQANGVGSGDLTGTTGLTTDQMTYGKIYKDATWTIEADSTLTSGNAPVLRYNNDGSATWIIAPLNISASSLGTSSFTYDGLSHNISDVLTAPTFDTSYSFLNLSNNYIYTNNNNQITSVKDAGNYTIGIATSSNDEFLNLSSQGTITVNKANATVTANSNSVTYNGQTQSVSGFSVSGLVNNEDKSVIDTISGDNASGTNVGTYTTSLSGADNNYNLSFNDGVLTITPKELTASYLAQNKIYDGTTAVRVEGSLDGIIANDNVDLVYSSNFEDKNVGENKTVNISEISLSGDSSSNYSLTNTTATTQASITPKELIASYTAQDKVYDGTTAVSVEGSLEGVVADDNITLSHTQASFSDKTAASLKTVNILGLELNGDGSLNYSLNNTSATTQASITPKELTASYIAEDKVYDGTNIANVLGSLQGVVGNDNVTTTFISAYFEDETPAEDKNVLISDISLLGEDSNNYTLANNTFITTASIKNSLQELIASIINNSNLQVNIDNNPNSLDGSQQVSIEDILIPLLQGYGNNQIIPGVVLKILNGGINLPYGIARQLSLNENTSQDEDNDDNKNKEEI